LNGSFSRGGQGGGPRAFVPNRGRGRGRRGRAAGGPGGRWEGGGGAQSRNNRSAPYLRGKIGMGGGPLVIRAPTTRCPAFPRQKLRVRVEIDGKQGIHPLSPSEGARLAPAGFTGGPSSIRRKGAGGPPGPCCSLRRHFCPEGRQERKKRRFPRGELFLVRGSEPKGAGRTGGGTKAKGRGGAARAPPAELQRP